MGCLGEVAALLLAFFVLLGPKEEAEEVILLTGGGVGTYLRTTEVSISLKLVMIFKIAGIPSNRNLLTSGIANTTSRSCDFFDGRAKSFHCQLCWQI